MSTTTTTSTVLDMTDKYTAMRFTLSQWRAALHIQINTGMGHSRGSVLAQVRRTSTLMPNAFGVALPHQDDWTPEELGRGSSLARGRDGVLVWLTHAPETRYSDAHKPGDAYYAPISSKGTLVRVFEDLDNRIVALGGDPWPLERLPIKRTGSTDKINLAADRKHARRIAATRKALVDYSLESQRKVSLVK